MNNWMVTTDDTLRLLETGEFVSEREYRQLEAAKACYITHLLRGMAKPEELPDIDHATFPFTGRSGL